MLMQILNVYNNKESPRFLVFCFLFLFFYIALLVANFQVGKILANIWDSEADSCKVTGGPERLDPAVVHIPVLFCCCRHKAVWFQLQNICLQHRQRLSISTLAHERLLPLFSECVPDSLWRVDRDSMGLLWHSRPIQLCSFLHDGHFNWKLFGK